MTRYQQSTIGAFVIGGLVLLILAIVFFGNIDLFSKKQKAIIVFPNSVSGLSVGSSVTFRGVKVGSVSAIKLRYDEEEHKPYIPVTIILDPRKAQTSSDYHDFKDFLQAMIKNGLCAEIDIESFVTGASSIYLNFNKNNVPIFHPKLTNHMLEIPTHPSTIQQIKSALTNINLEKLTNNLDVTILKIGQLSEALNQKLPILIDSVQRTSDQTEDLIAKIDKNFDHVVGNLNSLLVTTNQQVAYRGKDLHEVLLSLNKTMAQTSYVMKNINSLTSERSIERNNLSILLRNLAETSSSLRGFAKDIERNPKLLLTGRHQ